jgi:glycosyltransferase involved in cell wall biosynthesis
LNILIVTAWYHPYIHPRAHRWTALAEHWAAQGHAVHVVCARHRGRPKTEIINGVHVHRSGFDSLKEVVFYAGFDRYRRGRVGEEPRAPGRGARFLGWIYRNVWKRICFPDDACFWYWPARRRVVRLLDESAFDLLVSVSLPFTGHLVGLHAATKRRRRIGTWLADIGDPYSIHYQGTSLPGLAKRRLERNILEAADATTVTTAFTLQRYEKGFGAEAVRRMRVIPPLLHPKPEAHPPLVKTPADPIRLGYFGALYAPVRTPGAFLHLLQKTFERRPDLKARLEIHFYGEVFPEFFELLAAIPNVTLHGLRPRAEVQAAMRRMDVLVNIGNTTDYQLPSKAVEYLAAARPVLNLSFVENDPFAHFFRESGYSQYGPLLNIRTDAGHVTDEVLEQWLDWLEKGEKMPVSDWIAQTEPYLVDSIAAQYFSVIRSLGGGQAPGATSPDIAAE